MNKQNQVYFTYFHPLIESRTNTLEVWKCPQSAAWGLNQVFSSSLVHSSQVSRCWSEGRWEPAATSSQGPNKAWRKHSAPRVTERYESLSASISLQDLLQTLCRLKIDIVVSLWRGLVSKRFNFTLKLMFHCVCFKFSDNFSSCLIVQGRALSRAKSRRNLDFQDVLDKLADMGIAIRVASPKLVMEEVRKCSQTWPRC